MPNNNLILRSVVSPWITPTPDFTRNSVLSFSDVDQNFIYLKGELINSIETLGNTITLKKINGNDLSFNVGSGGGSDYWTSGSTGFYSIKTINDSGLDATGNYSVAEGFQTQSLGSYSRAGGFNTIAGYFRPEDTQVINYPISFSLVDGNPQAYINLPYDLSLQETLQTNLKVRQKAGDPWFGTITGTDPTTQYGEIMDISTTEVSGSEYIVLGVDVKGSGWPGTTGYTAIDLEVTLDYGEDRRFAHSHGSYTIASGEASFAGGQGQDANNGPVASGETSFVFQRVSNGLRGARSRNSVVLGGEENDIFNNCDTSVILGGFLNTISGAAENTVIIGGTQITATQPNTTYVDNLNIDAINSGTIANNLAIDANNNVIVGGKVTARRENIRYVDPVNGDNTSAAANYANDNFNYPYQSFFQAVSEAVAGDWIVLRPGTHTGSHTMKDGVNVFCEEGAIIDSFFQVNSSVTAQILGHAQFTSAGLLMTGNADGSDIHFEFDRIDTTNSYAIKFDTGGDGKLTVRGNYVSASATIGIYNGAKDVDIDIKEIHGFGNTVIQIGNIGTFPAAVMTGNIVINAGKIISTSTNQGGRTCIYLAEGLRASNPNDFKVIIKADQIIGSDAAANNRSVASCVWIDGGDNVHIYGDLIGKKAHAIASRGASASYHTGTFNFYNGNMSSDKAVVSSGQKGANGNGWHNLNFENCYLRTTGIGPNYEGGVIETTNNWNSIHGGTPGELFFNNCTFYNESSGDTIFRLDQPFSPDNGINANVNNSMLYVSGGTGFAAETVQTNRIINYFNTISNVDNDTNIINGLSGITNSFTFNNTINVPNKQL
jgi:hypothetical protein